jgi:outer membrane immunogenic protein
MRKLIIAALATSTLVAAPAMAADFTGTRVGATIGTVGNDVLDFDDTTVGVELGHDWDLGSAVVGIGAEYQTDLGNDFLDVNETALLARVGAKVGTSALVYASGGLTRISDGASPFDDGEEGFRLGGGVEFGIGTGGTSLKLEQRYVDYGDGADGWQTVAGIGVRF